jgi:Tfp pilus assembly protein PilN
MGTKRYREKIELPVYVVAVLIFLSSLGFLVFAVYYITFLPVPTPLQSLRVRILTTLQKEEATREYDIKTTEEETNIIDEDYLED